MTETTSKSFLLTQLPADASSGRTASSADGLTDSIFALAVGRVRIAAILSGTVWVLVLLANVAFSEAWAEWGFVGTAGWPAPNWIYAAIGAIGSVGLAWAIGRFRASPRAILDLGLGLEVFTAALIALIAFYEIAPHAARISWATAVILVYPAIAPAAPRRILVAGLLAASMDGLGFGLALLRGEGAHLSSGQLAGTLAWMLAPNYLCAGLALVPATLIRRLGREAGAARELGSYRLGRMLDRGGMGEVYEASHRMIAKPAAIKIIRPELLSDSPALADMIVERFYREAEAVAALKSPHTVALYDFGVAADGTLYYVMELLEGMNLQQLVERFGPQPPARVAHIIEQICHSLGEAHDRGMIHRDVKPSNIVLCQLGQSLDFVKVLDFGLVRREPAVPSHEDNLLSGHGPPGTPAYMAPETVCGTGLLDGRTDLYAVGCVGYWLLTGQPVFDGDSPLQIMYHHGFDPPKPPSERLGRPIPSDLERLILDALAKLPENRPANAAEFGRRAAACAMPRRWSEADARAWWAEHPAPPPAGAD